MIKHSNAFHKQKKARWQIVSEAVLTWGLPALLGLAVAVGIVWGLG